MPFFCSFMWNNYILKTWSSVILLYFGITAVLAATVPVCTTNEDGPGCGHLASRFLFNLLIFSLFALSCAPIPGAILYIRLVYHYFHLFQNYADSIEGRIVHAFRHVRAGANAALIDSYRIRYHAESTTTGTTTLDDDSGGEEHYQLVEEKVRTMRCCGCNHSITNMMSAVQLPHKYSTGDTVQLRVLRTVTITPVNATELSQGRTAAILEDDLLEQTPRSIIFQGTNVLIFIGVALVDCHILPYRIFPRSILSSHCGWYMDWRRYWKSIGRLDTSE